MSNFYSVDYILQIQYAENERKKEKSLFFPFLNN